MAIPFLQEDKRGGLQNVSLPPPSFWRGPTLGVQQGRVVSSCVTFVKRIRGGGLQNVSLPPPSFWRGPTLGVQQGRVEFTQFLWRSSRLIKPRCLWRLFDFLSSMFLFLFAFPRFPKLCLQPEFSQILFLFVGGEIVLCYFPFVGVHNSVSSLVIVTLESDS
ncbi:hypothetical protein HKD37_17G048408 [Glycine soja]